jgi:methyltransferase
VSAVYVILLAVVVERAIELAISTRNGRWLRARGAIEVGAGHYPLFFMLHGSWFIAIAYAVPSDETINWWFIAAFAILQLGRIWVLITLGTYWNTRIFSLPTQPLIVTGPYRWLRHPNYLIVGLEIPLLPLALGAWKVAITWSILNAALLCYRIHIEETALAPRRTS